MNDDDYLEEQVQYKLFRPLSLEQIVKDEAIQLESLIEGFIYKGGINLISGLPGVGKSLFAHILAGHLSTGKPLLGEKEVAQAKVLFLDRENSLPTIKERFEDIACDLSRIAFPRVEYSLKNKTLIKELKQYIADEGFDVIIVDTLRRLCDGEENSSQDISEFYSVLRELAQPDKTVIVLHHLKKTPADHNPTNEDARGSSDITAAVDAHFIIQALGKEGIKLVSQVKSRYSESMADLAFKFASDEEGNLDLLVQDSDYATESYKYKLTKDKILEFLAQATSSEFEPLASHIASSGGFAEVKVRGLLKQMIHQGLVNRRKEGKSYIYELA